MSETRGQRSDFTSGKRQAGKTALVIENRAEPSRAEKRGRRSPVVPFR
jgi:hypothetical protein